MVLIGDIEYKVVVISLRDSERRKTLQERLKKGGIDEYEVIDAQIPHPSNDEFIEQLAHGKFWRNDARLKNLSKMASRKACYISHVSNVLYEFGELPLLILEDDIVFKSSLVDIPPIPEECDVGFLDGTHIEIKESGAIVEDYSCGWKLIDTNKFRVWCLGCYIVPNPKKIYETIVNENPRVIDKMFIDLFQKEGKSYVYLPIVCKQDRETFESNIK